MTDPYEHKQRFPADAEATEGMGRITVHANENLAPSDRGIALMRRKLREQIRQVASGGTAPQVTGLGTNPVPTYAGDTVLKIPQSSQDESQFLSKLAHELMDIQYAADKLPERERTAFVIEKMKAIEVIGLSVPQ